MLAKNTPTALVTIKSDPKAAFHGIVAECREPTSDYFALLSKFKCGVEGGDDGHGHVVATEELDSINFVLDTRQIVHSVFAATQSKGSVVTATIYWEYLVGGRMIDGWEAGLVWESQSAAGQTFRQCSQKLQKTEDVKVMFDKFGTFAEVLGKKSWPVKFNVEILQIKNLFKAADAWEATDVTFTLCRATSPSPGTVSVSNSVSSSGSGSGSGSGSASAAAHAHAAASTDADAGEGVPGGGAGGGAGGGDIHWSLCLSFNTVVTMVPLEETMFVTMRADRGTGLSTRVIDVSRDALDALAWQAVCTNTYKTATITSFISSCGAESGCIQMTTGEDCNRQAFYMHVDVGDGCDHLIVISPSIAYDDL